MFKLGYQAFSMMGIASIITLYLLKNTKGITEKVVLGAETLKNWEMFQLPFNDIDQIKTQSMGQGISNLPVLKKGNFNLNQVGDTYLDFSKWSQSRKILGNRPSTNGICTR